MRTSKGADPKLGQNQCHAIVDDRQIEVHLVLLRPFPAALSPAYFLMVTQHFVFVFEAALNGVGS